MAGKCNIYQSYKDEDLNGQANASLEKLKGGMGDL